MTVQRMAVVAKDGSVTNVIVYDPKGNWPIPEGMTLIEDTGSAETGGTYAKGVFTAQPKPPQPPAEIMPPDPILVTIDNLTKRVEALEARVK